MEFLIDYGYIGVFIASFLAATVLPFSSEVVLTGVLLAGASYWPCMVAATLGNFLGGMSCYWLGMLGKVEWIEKYLKLDPVKLKKVEDWIRGKGSWTGFFVFLPGIGDFIAVALGFLHCGRVGISSGQCVDCRLFDVPWQGDTLLGMDGICL